MTEPNSVLAVTLGVADTPGPFPWQEELLAWFGRGEIPEALDIPTGLGKTAVMAVWLVARACGAQIPRRLVYIVDRRAVVDQATEEAHRLRKVVEDNPHLKRQLGLHGDRSLPISTLRGQFVDNREWLDDPAAPAIIVGTVDMIGSRLLFEGYGVSPKMRPYHAGLLGADALFVLDEAHLVPPFEHLMRSVTTDTAVHSGDDQCRKSVPPLRVLALSATGRTRGDRVMGLTERDLGHREVSKRLTARKSLRIETPDSNTTLEEELASRAWGFAEEGKKAVRVLVYADSRKVAKKAKKAVEERATRDRRSGTVAVDIETELFVGGRRVFERESAKERLKKLGFIAGSPTPRDVPVFLFATSAGEVGVDLDADHMVCDLVAWERMVQRLGRVNRRGDGDARVVVIVGSKPSRNNKDEEKAVRDWKNRQRPFQHLRKYDDGTYDASPAALLDLKRRAAADDALQEIIRDATTPEPLRPALTRPLVEAWAMTSLKKHTGRPAIEPWLRGWVKDDPQTAVVWRTHLPVRLDGVMPREREIENFFEAAPPHTSEILETETFSVVEWLTARVKSVHQQQTGQDGAPNEPVFRDDLIVAFVLDPDGGLRHTLRLHDLRPRVTDEGREDEPKKNKEQITSLLAGATLIVNARLGGLHDGLLDHTESGIPRTADDGQEWLGEGAAGLRVRSVEASSGVFRDRNWRERFRFAANVTEDGEVTRWLIVDKWRDDAATEDDRSLTNPQLLDAHQSLAEACARTLARTLVLDQPLVSVLALAARLHDEGKRALRWQRAFHAPGDGVYAKTPGPIDQTLLDGYRHELGTLLRIEQDERLRMLSEAERDLALHLVAAHHGFARPVIRTSGCEEAPPSALEETAADVALRFARQQERWGPWGLAWLEALLRAADQQASRENDLHDATEGDA